MSDITDIETLVRHLVQDFSHTQQPGDVFTYTTSSVFTPAEPNVIAITAVLHNDVALSSSDYSFDSTTNKVTVTAVLSSGDTIEIQYTYYPDFSSNEIENYVRSAVIFLSTNNYCTFQVDATDDNFYPEITDKEKNLVALVASISMKPDNVSYRLPDISFNVPNAMPTRDLISKAIAIFKHNTHGNFSIN